MQGRIQKVASPRQQQLVSTLQKVGFQGKGLKTAYAIAMRESGGNPEAFNPDRTTGDQSYGLFQINMLGDMGPARRRQFGISGNEQLLDPLTNARAAYKMSRGGKDFGAWGLGPNAYRAGAGFDTIEKFYRTFPGTTLKGDKSPVVPRMAAQGAANAVVNAREPVSTDDVGSYFANVSGLQANQQQITDEAAMHLQQLRRVNQAIQASAPSETTRSLLGRLGETGAKVAPRLGQDLSLPDIPSVVYRPRTPHPADEARVNQQFMGSLIPPISSKTGNVPGVDDPTTSKQMQKVLAIAHDQIGTPYVWGAEDPKHGFDCSGLIEYCYEQAGIPTPGRLTTQSALTLGKSVKNQKYLPGDMLITNGGKHMVMYVGKGKVIAAPHTGEVVQYQPVSRFKGDIVDVRRFH